jgi:hypothetical protein
MKPDNRTDGAAIRLYSGHRYTIVTIVNGAQPHTVEAGLRYFEADDRDRMLNP